MSYTLYKIQPLTYILESVCIFIQIILKLKVVGFNYADIFMVVLVNAAHVRGILNI